MSRARWLAAAIVALAASGCDGAARPEQIVMKVDGGVFAANSLQDLHFAESH